MSPRRVLIALLAVAAASVYAAAPAAALKVTWLPGAKSPGTPARYDKVGVIKVGPARARNVLVLEPGTSAGGAYFVPLAKWIVATAKGWQVWSIERRENLLEDQSELNLAKKGKANADQLFNYYLGWLTDNSIKHHFRFIPGSRVAFARKWGMAVAVGDLHRVIAAARKLGGQVVLGGHSLGGAVVTAYASWSFHGKAGADALAGLVYIDGASRIPAVTAKAARQELSALNAGTPWLTFGNIGAPFAGLFNAAGSTAALIDPDGLSRAGSFSLLPADLKPPVPATNLAQYGYALDVKTSPPALIAAQAHLGKLASSGNPRGWDGAGALTPIKRYATMFSGTGLKSVDGTEWYFPMRLTIDSAAVNDGNATAAQRVLGLRSTKGHHLPRTLRIYAFGAALGGRNVLASTRLLAKQSHIPARNLTLVNRHSTYAHNDPAGAYPKNVFFARLVRFLREIG